MLVVRQLFFLEKGKRRMGSTIAVDPFLIAKHALETCIQLREGDKPGCFAKRPFPGVVPLSFLRFSQNSRYPVAWHYRRFANFLYSKVMPLTSFANPRFSELMPLVFSEILTKPLISCSVTLSMFRKLFVFSGYDINFFYRPVLISKRDIIFRASNPLYSRLFRRYRTST